MLSKVIWVQEAGQVGIVRSFSNSGTVAAGADYAPFNTAVGRALQSEPFLNYLDVMNKDASTLLGVRLNGAANRQIPCDTNGGRVIIEPKDKIRFSDIVIRNLDASAATGADNIRVVAGRLEE